MKTETNAPDPALVKAVAHSNQVFDEVYNCNDPEALANLFTEDAVLVTDKGIFHGRAEILEFEPVRPEADQINAESTSTL